MNTDNNNNTLYIKKIQGKRYINNVLMCLLKDTVLKEFEAWIFLKELKTQDAFWVCADDCEDIAMCNVPQKIRTALKDF